MLPLVVVLGVLLLLGVYVVATYNGLVKLRNRIENAWSQVDVQLQRRYDLIPNLVETVKGYAAHESATFEAVTRARADAIAAKGPAQQAAADVPGRSGHKFHAAASCPKRAGGNPRAARDSLPAKAASSGGRWEKPVTPTDAKGGSR